MDYFKAAYKHMTKSQPDPQKAFIYLEKAHTEGNPEATYALGTWYLFGHNLEKNLKKAISLFQQAAQHNVPDALFDLAICYEKGEGVKKDEKSAFEHYLRGALYGEQQSVLEVGRCYYYGIGVTRDRTLSNIWLERAETLGLLKPNKKPSKAIATRGKVREKKNEN